MRVDGGTLGFKMNCTPHTFPTPPHQCILQYLLQVTQMTRPRMANPFKGAATLTLAIGAIILIARGAVVLAIIVVILGLLLLPIFEE